MVYSIPLAIQQFKTQPLANRELDMVLLEFMDSANHETWLLKIPLAALATYDLEILASMQHNKLYIGPECPTICRNIKMTYDTSIGTLSNVVHCMPVGFMAENFGDTKYKCMVYDWIVRPTYSTRTMTYRFQDAGENIKAIYRFLHF
jgi:hypothetical protein